MPISSAYEGSQPVLQSGHYFDEVEVDADVLSAETPAFGENHFLTEPAGSFGCGADCYDGGQCGEVCDTGCGTCAVGCCPRTGLRQLSLLAGVHGFKGPVDRGINGNFGFHEGVNWGAPLVMCSTVGYQVGFQGVHSNFEGDQVTGALRGGTRNQLFLTAGLFRRPVCQGIQWGVVFDHLHDAYHFGTTDLTQVRTEMSWVSCNRWELGFWGAFGTSEDELATRQGTLVPTDLYAFFYRFPFTAGGNGRFWTGFSGNGDAIVGAGLAVPLGGSLTLENNFNYLVSSEGPAHGDQSEESWGVAIQLVWYPGKNARCSLVSPYRPVMSVADNSVFMVDWK